MENKETYTPKEIVEILKAVDETKGILRCLSYNITFQGVSKEVSLQKLNYIRTNFYENNIPENVRGELYSVNNQFESIRKLACRDETSGKLV